MPTYVCSAATGRLTLDQKADISAVSLRSIMRRPARHATWSRSSSTTSPQAVELKSQMLRRKMQDAAKAAGAAEERVWVYLFEIPAEYGRVLASVKYGRTVSLSCGPACPGRTGLLSLPVPPVIFKSAGAISADSAFTTSLATERRPGRVLRKLVGDITVRMVVETRTMGTRMTPELDLTVAKPSHTVTAARLGYGREHAEGKHRCCQDCHQSSHHHTCFE